MDNDNTHILPFSEFDRIHKDKVKLVKQPYFIRSISVKNIGYIGFTV